MDDAIQAALDDAALDDLDSDPDGFTEAELMNVFSVSLILGIDEQLRDWVNDGLQGSPPEIGPGELDTHNFTTLCPEQLPVLDMLHSMSVFTADAWQALEPIRQALEEEIGAYTSTIACCCVKRLSLRHVSQLSIVDAGYEECHALSLHIAAVMQVGAIPVYAVVSQPDLGKYGGDQ